MLKNRRSSGKDVTMMVCYDTDVIDVDQYSYSSSYSEENELKDKARPPL